MVWTDSYVSPDRKSMNKSIRDNEILLRSKHPSKDFDQNSMDEFNLMSGKILKEELRRANKINDSIHQRNTSS